MAADVAQRENSNIKHYSSKKKKKKKKEDRCRHVLTNNFHRIVHEKKEVWRVIPCVFLLSHLQLLFFFLQILKAGLNNGDGLSKHVGQSL